MKVLIATTSFPRWSGDVRAPFILEAARAIAAQGVGVRVVTVHSPGARTREVMESVEAVRPRYLWPERLEVLQREAGGLPVMWRKSRLARLAMLPLLITHTLWITRFAADCDLIHANWTLSAMAAWGGQLLHRKPFIVTAQGSDIFQGAQTPLIGLLTKAALNASSAVVALSGSLADAVARMGVTRTKIWVIPNGVDTKKFFPTTEDRRPVVLFVGSLTENKGVRYLLQAWPVVSEHLPGFRLVLIGDGPQRAEFEKLAGSLHTSDQVDFLGSQSQVEVSRWMRQARAFVLPSLSEGLGVVLLEALASGTPCVGSRVGGIPDVITPEVGALVPPADPEALGSALLGILGRDENDYREMGQQARRRACEVFHWEKVARRIIEVYHQALSPG